LFGLREFLVEYDAIFGIIEGNIGNTEEPFPAVHFNKFHEIVEGADVSSVATKLLVDLFGSNALRAGYEFQICP